MTALAFAVLTVGAAVTGAAIPRPGAAAADVLAYDSTHVGVLTLLGTLLFASSIALVIWAATTYRQLRRLGVAAPGPLMGSPVPSSPLARSRRVVC